MTVPQLPGVEKTLLDSRTKKANQSPPKSSAKDCCLVQIYPTDVVDGLQRVEKASVTLGRDSRCDIVLDDANVSRQHAKLEKTEQGYLLTDLGSTNGTYVDEVLVNQQILKGGETLRLGSFIFKFLSADCLEAQYHETVYNAMTRDGLTHAFNKNYLLDSLEQELARSRRSGSTLSIVMMDIDHFKSVNDTHGHLVGDEVLKEFAKRLQSVSRAGDLLCRYGGEEFALVLVDTPLHEALEAAERCRQVVASTPFETASGPLDITTSLGACDTSFAESDLTPTQLIKLADDHLYQAKRSGRNRVCAPSPASVNL